MKIKNVAFFDTKQKKLLDYLKKGKFEDKELYDFIMRAVDDMKEDPFVGINIPKKLIPKEYIKNFGISNLRKYDLPNGWRLLYTIKADDIQILAIILEWLDHKNYERRFRY